MIGTVETPGFADPTNHKRDRWLDAETHMKDDLVGILPQVVGTYLHGHTTLTVTICLRDRTA